MTVVNNSIMTQFVELAQRRLKGNWVVIGGALLPLLGVGKRVTLDIDLAGPEDATQSETLILMEIAEELGLPVEAINQAGAYFLQRIPGWEKRLVPVTMGPKCGIFRPDVTLYLLLKIGRLSETDLADCEAFLRYSAGLGEEPDRMVALAAIDAELAKRPAPPRCARLGRMRTWLTQAW